MQTLQKVLAEIVQERGISKKINEQKALLAWDEVVGKTVSLNTQPARIVDGILFVYVANSVWAHQLSFFSHSYVSNLNKMLNDKVVKEVRFTVSQIGLKNQLDLKAKADDSETNEDPLEQVELSDDQIKTIEKNLQNIEDLGLRERLRSIMTSQKKLSILRQRVESEEE